MSEKYSSMLIDFNNLAIRNLFGAKEIIENGEVNYNLWYHNIFQSIYAAIWKFRNVGEVILALDDTNSWRKSYYPRYKESRKNKKDKAVVDWNDLYSKMNFILSEMKHHLPFKIMKVKNTEADDIIGILAKHMKNEVIVVSRDEDYFQIFGHNKKAKIYDSHLNKVYTVKDFPDIKNFLMKLVFCGQKKDDIPNILTPNDWGLNESTEGKRKPGFGEKAFDKIKDDLKGFLDKGYENQHYGKVDLRENLKRNRILMDFDMIPHKIEDNILNCYNNSNNLPPIENIYLFFEKFGFRVYMDDIHRVENKLKELY